MNFIDHGFSLRSVAWDECTVLTVLCAVLTVLLVALFLRAENFSHAGSICVVFSWLVAGYLRSLAPGSSVAGLQTASARRVSVEALRQVAAPRGAVITRTAD